MSSGLLQRICEILLASEFCRAVMSSGLLQGILLACESCECSDVKWTTAESLLIPLH